MEHNSQSILLSFYTSTVPFSLSPTSHLTEFKIEGDRHSHRRNDAGAMRLIASQSAAGKDACFSQNGEATSKDTDHLPKSDVP